MGSRLTTPLIGSDRSRAALARDAALARVRRTRRWVILGAAGLTAGIAALVASVAPGRTLTAKSSSADTGTSTVASTGGGSVVPSLPAPASASELGLQGPDQAPSPAPQSPSQSAPQPSQPQSDPQPTQPQSAPQPSGGGGVVSGGS
jgi:hypothetical protein